MHMKQGLWFALAVLVSSAHATENRGAEQQLAYCVALASRTVEDISKDGTRAAAMRWMRLSARYIDRLEELAPTTAQRRALLDRALEDIDAENARLRASERPLFESIRSTDQALAACDELAAARPRR